MNGTSVDIARLIDDRPEDGIFRVNRDVFTDPAVFELEMERIFEGTWVFIGLASQVAKPHDFVTLHIGRQPVLLTRDGEGRLGCFMNTCRHRGTIVCPFKNGNTKFHVCRYHGWAYDSGGRSISITDQDTGQYPAAFSNEKHDLVPVPRFAEYRGLLFASLSADVPSLEEHLGEARALLDLVLDQSEQGFEFVPGSISYTFDGNWKLQFENGLDYYHFASTHSSYVDVLKKRPMPEEQSRRMPDQDFETEPEAQGTFSLPRGHSVMWSIQKTQRALRPLAYDADRLQVLRQRVGHTRWKWMMRNRNLTIYPNLQIIDICSLQVRTWRPLAPGKTEMTSHCLAPIGESAEARALRIRQYEDFFNPSGFASSDDNVMYEYCQSGYAARDAGWTQGYSRGLGGPLPDGVNLAQELGLETATWTYGTRAFGDETCFHTGYREWYRLLTTPRRAAV
ncbi:MAG TPA: aromatic ring-hydroxylating dioxygenase subunit alpha [Pseudolabrys sp.]|nr:aromatic ring-hydroxylating dioxygenase subunit alpha [Pseudolabrys sp.]